KLQLRAFRLEPLKAGTRLPANKTIPTEPGVPMPFLLIMPSYNQSHYIGSAIDSILAQEDPDWELWIVDNSSDDTPAVVQKYQDVRIKFFHIPERMDPGTCLNWALQRAEGRDFS